MSLSVKVKMLLLLLMWSFAQPIFAQNDPKEAIRVTAEKKADSVDLYIENLKTFEVTVTLTFPILENMRADLPLPYTETFPGGSRAKLATLYKIDLHKRWEYRYQTNWTFGSIYAKHDNSHIYDLPYTTGESHTVTQGFNGKFSHYGDNQYAIDWGMLEGTEVHTARGGMVVGVEERFSKGGAEEKYRDYVNYVMIKHSDGTVGEYDHLKQYGVVVNVGQKVKSGDLLGYSGNVGFSSGPHLHFFVYRAVNGENRQSFPIQFRTSKGIETLLKGKSYSAPGFIPEASTVTCQGMRFFEADNPPPKRSKRSYSEIFSQRNAHYIYYEVYLKNSLWQVRDNKVKLEAYYYNPDGSLMGNPVLDYTIPSDWDYAYLWHGWGWKDAGKWDIGTYRVEIFIDGKKLTEKSFSVFKASKTVEYQSIRFFEGSVTPPEQSIRSYSQNFARSARYIYYEVYLKNLLWQKSDNPVELHARYYKPDGSIFGEPVLSYTIPSDWDYAYLWHGWGWKDPGNWVPGVYRVEITLGGEKIAQDSFTIREDATVQYQSMRFFEASFNAPERSKRVYSSTFSGSSVRYIYYEIYLKNLLWQKSDNPVELHARYYAPDGSIFGEPVLDYTISRDWDYAYLWHGWGWKDPGNWTPGVYRVEIVLGDEKIAEGCFTVY